jgi:hypothetical protein
MTKPEARNIVLDLVLTLLLCGLWNLVVQYKQIEALNHLLRQEKYSFWKTYLFSLLTCGLYLIYYEYQKSKDLCRLTGRDSDSDPVLAVILCLFGLNIVYDAIAQSKINALLDRENAKLV